MTSDPVPPAAKKKVLGIAGELWKVTFAYAGFVDARKCIKDLQEKGFSKDSPQYYPLLVGLICLYARPFTRAEQIGMLSDKIIPTQFRKVHGELLRLRDEMFAHSDPTALMPGALSSEDFASGIVFRREERHAYVIPSRFHANTNFLLDRVLPLLEALIDSTDKKRKQLQNALAQFVPQRPGDYELNVLDIDKPLFKRVPAGAKLSDRFK